MIIIPHNADVIIYNDYGAGASRIVVQHALPGVWWEGKRGVTVIQNGISTANNIRVMLTTRKGYRTPQEWQGLTPSEVLSGGYYTLQEGDRLINGRPPNAPATLTSMTAVDKYFGAQYSHEIMNVAEKILPGGVTHHFELECK